MGSSVFAAKVNSLRGFFLSRSNTKTMNARCLEEIFDHHSNKL